MNVGSLFSGIGGIDLGLERAGMNVIWQSEIDPYASQVLAKHWPAVPNLGDITRIDWSTVERPDLICGGYPCQPFSLAGARGGATDPRHLWPYFADALRHLRPRYALLENVPGHLSLGFGRVLGDLAELGYDTEWDCIPAAAVGAPHLRYRVFVVAHTSEWGRAQQHHSAGTDLEQGHGIEPRHRAGPSDVPDTDVDVVRLQPVSVGRGSGEAVARHDGAQRDVADTGPQTGRRVGARRWSEQSTSSSGTRTGHHWTVEPAVGVGVDGLSTRLDGGRVDGQPTQAGPGEVLRSLRNPTRPQEIPERAGVHGGVLETPLLRSEMHGGSLCQAHVAAELEAETGHAIPWDLLRGVWGYGADDCASHRRELGQRLAVEHPDLVRVLSRHAPPPCSSCWVDGSWESDIPRVTHGVANRVDRLRCLGNAVVPQVAELIGRAIMEADAA